MGTSFPAPAGGGVRGDRDLWRSRPGDVPDLGPEHGIRRTGRCRMEGTKARLRDESCLEARMIAETLCSAVSAAGLGIAVVTAYRKRFLAAARIAAYSLVPVGLVMTGVVGWAADTAFSPSAWAGFGVLGGAWLLFTTTRAVERRKGGSRTERRETQAAQRHAHHAGFLLFSQFFGACERPFL